MLRPEPGVLQARIPLHVTARIGWASIALIVPVRKEPPSFIVESLSFVNHCLFRPDRISGFSPCPRQKMGQGEKPRSVRVGPLGTVNPFRRSPLNVTVTFGMSPPPIFGVGIRGTTPRGTRPTPARSPPRLSEIACPARSNADTAYTIDASRDRRCRSPIGAGRRDVS